MDSAKNYEYIALAFGTLSLTPQLLRTYLLGSASELSYLTLLMMITGGIIWSIYVHENFERSEPKQLNFEFLACLYFTITAFLIFSLKLCYKLNKVREKYGIMTRSNVV